MYCILIPVLFVNEAEDFWHFKGIKLLLSIFFIDPILIIVKWSAGHYSYVYW